MPVCPIQYVGCFGGRFYYYCKSDCATNNFLSASDSRPHTLGCNCGGGCCDPIGSALEVKGNDNQKNGGHNDHDTASIGKIHKRSRQQKPGKAYGSIESDRFQHNFIHHNAGVKVIFDAVVGVKPNESAQASKPFRIVMIELEDGNGTKTYHGFGLPCVKASNNQEEDPDRLTSNQEEPFKAVREGSEQVFDLKISIDTLRDVNSADVSDHEIPGDLQASQTFHCLA